VVGSVRITIDDAANRSANIGYIFRSAYWGRGFASEGCAAILRIAFTVLGIHRLWAVCDVRNAASRRVMEKLGMRQEGTLVQNQVTRDGWRDSAIYAVLSTEWHRAEERSP
jgi:RimJ/RimL family protein N-acetyltransferase